MISPTPYTLHPTPGRRSRGAAVRLRSPTEEQRSRGAEERGSGGAEEIATTPEVAPQAIAQPRQVAPQAIAATPEVAPITLEPISVELEPEEKAKGIKSQEIARDGIAIIVNNANGLDSISSDQVKQIYTGKITKWSEIK